MKIAIADELRSVLRLGVLRLGAIRLPVDGGDALWAEIERVSAELAGRYAGLTAGQIPETGETRKLYRAVGLDPTKTRPSSEALLRRIVKGKPLYRVHPLVDLFNLVSVTAQLSVGLYDEAKIAGDKVTVRLGGESWGFEGIRRGRINVAGRLCAADRDGPFGSPTADSLRTSITDHTERALAIFFQHLSGDPSRLERALDRSAELAARHLNASVPGREVIEMSSGGF
jgi:DNA/RNA-binding domain of Phe-tRNA-synthetase-like protein